MRKLALAAALGAAFSTGAWGQAPPPGTYVFVSGPGVGTPPFTVTGFSTSLGGSIGGIHIPNCSGIHVHGTFNGFADPNTGGCGHGIIQLVVPPPPVSGGALPGGGLSNAAGVPTNVAGQLALTTRGTALDPNAAGDAFLLGVTAFAASNRALSTDATGRGLVPLMLIAYMTQETPDLSKTMGVMSNAISLEAERDAKRAQSPETVVKAALAEPAQRALSAPATVSWLEEFAAYDDQAGDGYGKEADRSKQQADEWHKLAEDARRDAERNRQRAEDARREGRDADGRNWDAEAERDRAEAEKRDREAKRLGGWSEEMREREARARAQAEARRAEAEAARERVRQAERDRVERVRRAAEEKARLAEEARNERLRRERAEVERSIQELEDRVRARQVEAARQRAAREREHRQWLAEQEAQRNARARGSSSDADLAAAAARAAAAKKKKKEEEEQSLVDTLADYVIGAFEGNESTRTEQLLKLAADKAKEKFDLKEKLKEEFMERSGAKNLQDQVTERVTDKIDDLGLGNAAGKLTEGFEEFQKVRKLGEWMDSELQKQPGERRKIETRMEVYLSGRPHMEFTRASVNEANQGRLGNLYGREVAGVVKRGVEATK